MCDINQIDPLVICPYTLAIILRYVKSSYAKPNPALTSFPQYVNWKFANQQI